MFSCQFDEKRHFRLSSFEFFSASRKETIKTARHAHHDRRARVVPNHPWRMGNSFGKIDDVTPSPMEQLSAAIYLDFTGFDQKCFIGRVMNVRRCQEVIGIRVLLTRSLFGDGIPHRFALRASLGKSTFAPLRF
jgi:hypothetical protein